MIQLSTPIQTAIPIQSGINETEGSRLDGLPDHEGQIAEKNDGPGIFAKLLESLAARGKTAESGDAETDEAKLPPEAEETNTSHRLFTERLDLLIDQVIGPLPKQAIGLSLEQPIDQSVDLSIERSIASLIEPGIWPEAEKSFMPEDSEGINGEARLMEALFTQGRKAGQTGDEEAAPKGRQLVHTGEVPREMILEEETAVESGENSALSVSAEVEEEGEAAKTAANEDSANAAAKKAQGRSSTAASMGQTETEIFPVKYQGDPASLVVKQPPENGEGRRGSPTAAESRGKKGKERINLEFLDLRTEGQAETGNARALNAQGQTPLKGELEISVDLNPKAGSPETGKAGGETHQARAFEDALAMQLRGDLSTDIVRDAAVIARNGGEGTIRLTLHPASMGNVKIRLEMTENKITGLIVVESDEALKAFQRELPVLEKAFRDSGFSETNLEMSLAQDGGNFDGGEGRKERDFSALASVAASRYEADSGWAETEWVETLPPLQGETVVSARPERIPVNLLI